MISTLDFFIARLFGISSMAILIGQSSVVALGGSTIALSSSPVSVRLCTVELCSGDGSASVRLDFKNVLSKDRLAEAHSVLSQSFQIFDAGGEQFADYTPPGCNDTDSDQTNNCGPGDSTDAGTRMSG